MNTDEKTLVILIPGFPKDEQDSTCVPFPQSFVKNFKRINPALKIIVLAFQYPFSAGVYQWNGVEVHAFNGGNRGKINRVLLWIAVWRRLNKIIKEESVIGLLSFWLGECAFIAKFAAGKFRLRSYSWLLGQDAKKNNRYVSLIRPAAGSLVAISDFIADEYFRNYGIRPAHTIAPGLDIKLFPPEAKERDIDIMGAGSLIPLKQYDQFLKIVSHFARYRSGMKAIICGEGPERLNLEQKIREYQLGDHVTLVGELQRERVLEFMQRSKIFLHPSSYEGFATVCTEALYAGAAVVSYCNPMHTGFGHLHIVKSEEEMELKLRELLSDEHLSHERILTCPIEETCRQILSLYC